MRIFILAALAVVMSASSASASVFGSIVRKGAIGSPIENGLQDTNREYLVPQLADRFSTGDRVELYMQWDKIQSSDLFYNDDKIGDIVGGGYSLLARASLTITNISNIGLNGAGKTVGDFEFDGEVIFLEKLAQPDFEPFPASIAAADAIIAAATEIFRIGKLEADDFITALAAPIFFADIPSASGSTVVNANFGLSLISGGGDLGLVKNGVVGANGDLHDFQGFVDTKTAFGNVSIGSGDDRFDLQTNSFMSFTAQVPEPTSILGFVGLALCGLNVRRRMDKRA